MKPTKQTELRRARAAVERKKYESTAMVSAMESVVKYHRDPKAIAILTTAATHSRWETRAHAITALADHRILPSQLPLLVTVLVNGPVDVFRFFADYLTMRPAWEHADALAKVLQDADGTLAAHAAAQPGLPPMDVLIKALRQEVEKSKSMDPNQTRFLRLYSEFFERVQGERANLRAATLTTPKTPARAPRQNRPRL